MIQHKTIRLIDAKVGDKLYNPSRICELGEAVVIGRRMTNDREHLEIKVQFADEDHTTVTLGCKRCNWDTRMVSKI